MCSRRSGIPTLRWMAATLDGRVEATGAVWKRRLPFAGGSFGEIVGASRIAQCDQAAVGFASV